ncbi:hypothetical protein B9Z55_028662 [Caenorhabditis nigoni]|uniref:Uncharacterized protein n=1 Tax=Caenorhabditis nigoni TaxID=1611254 RepID=A0A2G5SAV0_9PELO|nr:hypothetical protein B9Z55_028662 [Caenorhabditis nigoni]
MWLTPELPLASCNDDNRQEEERTFHLQMNNIFLALARLHSIRTLDLFEDVRQVVQGCVLPGVLSTEYFNWKCIPGSEEDCYFHDSNTIDFKQKMTTILTNKSLLRSDFPLPTVARFVETGEKDPREIINKKQAYEMRRYVMANARKRTPRKFEDLYFDESMFEQVQYYGDHDNHHHHGGPMGYRAHQSETGREANLFRLEGRRFESRITRMLDARLPGKNHTDVMSEWLQTLVTTSPDEYGLMVPELAVSIRKHLDEMLGEPNRGKKYKSFMTRDDLILA